MSGLAAVFARCREEGRAALVGYLPAGYPTMASSLEAMRVLVDNGVDIVEVGLPYSDPLMDGPMVATAVEQALAAGFRVDGVFEAVQTVTEAGGAAVVMTYWNPVLRRGVERFAADLRAAGGHGLITPDLIPDEAEEWRAVAAQHGLDPIFLVAPSSTDARLAMTTAASRGFVYAASTMGVTGVRATVGDQAARLVARVRAVSDLPVCVGLGVSTGGQAAEVARFADGVIVGSALVRALNQSPAALAQLTQELSAGVRGAA